jgi:5'-deoxynucleotidase YfbR-like HD superfamily hydrolase
MMLITLIDDFPELDLNKCFYLALIHDIVEIYAGDTVLGDTKMEKTQKEREEEAIKKMDSEF